MSLVSCTKTSIRLCSLLLSRFLRYALMVESALSRPVCRSSHDYSLKQHNRLDQPTQMVSRIGSSNLVDKTACLSPAFAVLAFGCGSQSTPSDCPSFNCSSSFQNTDDLISITKLILFGKVDGGLPMCILQGQIGPSCYQHSKQIRAHCPGRAEITFAYSPMNPLEHPHNSCIAIIILCVDVRSSI